MSRTVFSWDSNDDDYLSHTVGYLFGIACFGYIIYFFLSIIFPEASWTPEHWALLIVAGVPLFFIVLFGCYALAWVLFALDFIGFFMVFDKRLYYLTKH